MRLLSWIITIPVALLALSFALSNREDTVLRLWPLPFDMTVPVFLVGLLALVLGFVAGGITAWLAGHRHRAGARRARRHARRIEQDLEAERMARAQAERRLAEAARQVADSAALVPVDAAARQQMRQLPAAE